MKALRQNSKGEWQLYLPSRTHINNSVFALLNANNNSIITTRKDLSLYLNTSIENTKMMLDRRVEEGIFDVVVLEERTCGNKGFLLLINNNLPSIINRYTHLKKKEMYDE